MKSTARVHQTETNLLLFALFAAFHFCAIFTEANFVDSEFGKKVLPSSRRQELDLSSSGASDELQRKGRNLLLRQPTTTRKDNKVFAARSLGNTRKSTNQNFVPIFNATKASNLNPLSAMGLHLPPHLLNAINPGQNLDQIEDELSEMLFGSEEDSAENINLSTERIIDGDRGPEYADYDYRDYDVYDQYHDIEETTKEKKKEENLLPEANKNITMLPSASEFRQRHRRPGAFQAPFLRRQRPLPGGIVMGPHLPGAARNPNGKVVISRNRPYIPLSNARVGAKRNKPPLPISKLPFQNQLLKKRNKAEGGSFSARRPYSGESDEPECDAYTEELCLKADNYPSREILTLLSRNVRVGNDLVADVMDQSADNLIDGVTSAQENKYTFSHYFGDNRRQDGSVQATRDFAHDGGFLCPSEIMYAKPKRGKTAQGVWKDIVNVKDYTQTLRMEKCLKPGGECSYVSHHYKSQCSQVYNYHRLLSWSKDRGLHMDIYKVPTCCSCHIMGYSYVYPPLKRGAPSAPHAPSPPKGSFHDVINDDADFIDGFGTPLIDDDIGGGGEFVPSQQGGGGSGNFVFPDEIAGGFNNEVAVDPPFPTAPQEDFQNFMVSVTNSATFPNDVPDTSSSRDVFGAQPSNESPSTISAPPPEKPSSKVSSRTPHQLAPPSRPSSNRPHHHQRPGQNRPPHHQHQLNAARKRRRRPQTSILPRRRIDNNNSNNNNNRRLMNRGQPKPQPQMTAAPDFDEEISNIFGTKAADFEEEQETAEDPNKSVNYGYHPIIDFFDRYRWSAAAS